MTVNGYTAEEDNSEAILVVSSWAIRGERTRVIANRSASQPGDYVTLQDLERCLAS